jgi:hypothetical protein
LVGTRCAHLNCNNKKTKRSVREKDLREDQQHNEEHKTTGIYQQDGESKISQSPHGEASGVATLAATSRLISRSLAPRDGGPQAVTGESERSRSPSRGPGRPSSRRDEAVASGASQLHGYGTTQGLQTWWPRLHEGTSAPPSDPWGSSLTLRSRGCWWIKLISTYDPQAYRPTPFSPQDSLGSCQSAEKRDYKRLIHLYLLTYPNPNLRLN